MTRRKKQLILLTLFSFWTLLFNYGCNQKNDASLLINKLEVKDTIIASNGSQFDFVQVEKGTYFKGYQNKAARIDYDFFIMKYEVTNRQYQDYLNELVQLNKAEIDSIGLKTFYHGDRVRPAGDYHLKYWSDYFYAEADQIVINKAMLDHPVVDVSLFGALLYCEFYGFDLPEFDEWEKAARGETKYDFPWGNKIDSTYANYANSDDPFEPGTTPVGYYNGTTQDGFQTSDNSSIYGCYDMAGNAWEWTKTTWTKDHPFVLGGGGGFSFHYSGSLRSWLIDCVGTPYPQNLDRCNGSDGFRAIIRKL